jgi:LAO/AO transport system kinase
MLGRAITLVESAHPGHQRLAGKVLTELMPHTGRSIRVGTTGAPGVGKSTFIDRLGTNLTGHGHRVAVLAVDPSSGVSGGSILGDKTRMVRLAADPNAFIRPSPSAGTLGGVASKTRETLLLCEAAGFDVVLVETLGVGQAETVVANMTDFFLVLVLPGAGDELQGIKRGLLELAHLVAVNKADGDGEPAARRTAAQYESALRTLRARDPDWMPPVVACSATGNVGLDTIWDTILRHREWLRASGGLDTLRREQMLHWMWSLVEERLVGAFRHDRAVARILERTERAVLEGSLPPSLGARRLLGAFGVEE